VLDALSRLLRADAIAVVATESDGMSALEAIRANAPDVAVLDVKLSGLSGIEIARSIDHSTAAILYTSYRDRMSLRDALDAGARALVLKEAPLDDMIRAIHAVAGGGMYIDPLLAGAAVATENLSLTSRERDVLQMLADGEKHEAIEAALSIAPDTVRAHVRNAMRKLEVNTRTQAVAEALRRSLID
jgi:two-component system response regulator DesR